MTSAGVQTFDSFTTNENGCVYTLEKLLKGNYTLVETKAPEGYVLDSTPVSLRYLKTHIQKMAELKLLWLKRQIRQ